jgi:hypothetical protein
MTWPRATVGMAMFLLLATIVGRLHVSVTTAEGGQAPSVQSRLIGYQVAFQFTQDARQVAPATVDQITVIFANRSVEGTRPPRPFFGDDIVQEFSFSGMDFEGNQLRFSRRLRDRSFLDARYIRVINYGADGWQADKIWLTVDGEEILRGVTMTPRAGTEPSKGLQKFNPRDWSGRTYWEAELAQFRKASRSQ